LVEKKNFSNIKERQENLYELRILINNGPIF